MILEQLDYNTSFQFIQEVQKRDTSEIYFPFVELIQNKYSLVTPEVNFGLIYLEVKILFINYDELHLKFIMFISHQHESLLNLVEKIISPHRIGISNFSTIEKVGIIKQLFSNFELDTINNIDFLLSIFYITKKNLFGMILRET